ncbi:MAG TPA: MerR family transcriptional regulator [Streptosporangiaceae bacterium]|nr:MerR family transcriptional regulator [Streptosporangiaceae bacterium]
MSARAGFGIGEVLAQLRGEFPDVSVSKIRFLESEGLIRPARSPSNYRRFGPADVARLRYILTAQRDEYLPLRVIKDRLAEADGEADAGPDGDAAARPPGRRPLSRRELLDAAGIDESYLTELEDFGLVRASGRQFEPEALDAARIIVALGKYGVQARHLRAVRAAVERETALIEQVVAPTLRQRSLGSRERAGQTAREVAALSLRLHASLMGSSLAEAGLDAAGLDAAGPDAAGPPPARRPEPGRAGRGYGGNGFAGPAAAGSGA